MLDHAHPPGYHGAVEPEADLTNSTIGANDHSDLREFLTLVRRHWLLIAVVALVTGVLTYEITVREPAQYASATTLVYSSTDAASSDATTEVPTIVGLSSSTAVLAPIAPRLKLTVGQLAASLNVSNDGQTNLISIGATAATPRLAARIANRVAESLIVYSIDNQRALLEAQIKSLQQQIQTFAGRTDPSSVNTATDLRTTLSQTEAELSSAAPPLAVVSPAVAPTAATAPHPKRDALIGLFAGLVIGIMLAGLRDRLDRRVRGLAEIEAIYKSPTLGLVPYIHGRRQSRSSMLADFSDGGALVDAYRTVRTNLALLQADASGSSIVVVTSAVAGEGKSAVAANLAHGLSVMGKHVLAVSADLHNPSLHEYFADGEADDDPEAEGQGRAHNAGRSAGQATAGLVQVISGSCALADAVREIPLSTREQVAGGSLTLLADTSTFFDPAVLFSSASMRAFLETVRERYEVIVFDTPPLNANADATLLAQDADLLVMVARLDLLTKNQARRALQVMRATNLVPAGVIVIGDTDEPGYGYGYGYGYRSESSAANETRQRKPRRPRDAEPRAEVVEDAAPVASVADVPAESEDDRADKRRAARERAIEREAAAEREEQRRAQERLEDEERLADEQDAIDGPAAPAGTYRDESERRAAEYRAAELRAVERRAAELRAAEQRAAEQRAAEELAAAAADAEEEAEAELRAAEQREAKRSTRERLDQEREEAERRAAEQREVDQREAELRESNEREAIARQAQFRAPQSTQEQTHDAHLRDARRRAAVRRAAELHAAEQREAERRNPNLREPIRPNRDRGERELHELELREREPGERGAHEHRYFSLTSTPPAPRIRELGDPRRRVYRDEPAAPATESVGHSSERNGTTRASTSSNANGYHGPVWADSIEREQVLRARLCDIARAHPDWGHRLAWGALLHEGWKVDRKEIRALWRDEGLQSPGHRDNGPTALGTFTGSADPYDDEAAWDDDERAPRRS